MRGVPSRPTAERWLDAPSSESARAAYEETRCRAAPGRSRFSSSFVPRPMANVYRPTAARSSASALATSSHAPNYNSSRLPPDSHPGPTNCNFFLFFPVFSNLFLSCLLIFCLILQNSFPFAISHRPYYSPSFFYVWLNDGIYIYCVERWNRLAYMLERLFSQIYALYRMLYTIPQPRLFRFFVVHNSLLICLWSFKTKLFVYIYLITLSQIKLGCKQQTFLQCFDWEIFLRWKQIGAFRSIFWSKFFIFFCW